MTAQSVLPRWRGFNILNMFHMKSKGDFDEDQFRWMADWGFDFVRFPMCYTLWIEGDDPYKLHESMLENLDRAVELGRKYGLHVDLNFHRAPGFSVNREREEPFNLWKDQDALDAFIFHWQTMAKRYKGVPNEELSINLVNEPKTPDDSMTLADHERVVRAAVAAIREVDAERLIIADGTGWGNDARPELADLGVGQSCRGYVPGRISHYKAQWVSDPGGEPPTWPGDMMGEHWDRARLEKHYAPWIELAEKGVGVHCGEGGCYCYTPHATFLAWFRDVLEILTEAGIGYALWNFVGAFGVIDSVREDVDYEDFHGHKLDRKLLDLLLEF